MSPRKHPRFGRALLAALVPGWLLLPFAAPAQADTISVSTTVDAVDSQPGNGACTAAGGGCTLRAAIQEANAQAGLDTILLPSGLYRLTLRGGSEDAAATGDLDVVGRLVVKGQGKRRPVIDANGQVTGDRGVHVLGGAFAAFFRVTVRNGHVIGSGGGIRIDSGRLTFRRGTITGNTATDQGAGVYNQGGRFKAQDSAFLGNAAGDDGGGIGTNSPGNLAANVNVLSRVIIRENTARMDAGGVEIEEGALSLLYSTVSGNEAMLGDGGGIEIDNASMTMKRSAVFDNATGDNGGGIENDTGRVTLKTSTISRNTAAEFGGGIDQTERDPQTGAVSVLEMKSTTVHGNAAGVGGGGVSNRLAASLVARKSLLAANGPQDCGGDPNTPGSVVPILSGGFNLASDGTCNLTQTSDLPGTDPLVGPLALNGGPTRTHALLPNSPAIDAATGGPSTDQRGVPRPQGPEPDIGAFELEYCAGRRPTITGSEAISGTAADDVILGSVGADRIRAGAGDDLVCAGGGSDKVLGGPGDDRVGGSAGDDRLSGSAGDDVLRGGTEDDKLYGGDGRDGVLGQAGRDRAFGGPNEDRVDVRDGVAQNDRADGGSGIDSCLADTGDLVVNCP